MVAGYKHYNTRGDVIAQSDSAGVVTWAGGYESGGKRLVEKGTTADRQKANTKEEDPTGLLNEGFRYRDMEIGMFLSRDPAGFVDGPNLYAYVRQNPWSAFDPEGLETVAQHTANAQWAAKNGKYLDMTACTFMAFGRAMNPADSNSELRKASAQMPALVDNARKEINNSSIPAPLKFVAKAAMATAGNADPLQLLEGGVQVKNTLQTHGWGTAGVMLDGMKKAASEDPAYFVAQLTSGFLMGGGGKMLSKPGSGVLADSAKNIVNSSKEAATGLSSAEFEALTADLKTTSLYHGGKLTDGVVAARRLSTTTELSYAELHAAKQPGGSVYRFDVPNTVLEQWKQLDVSPGLDSFGGVQGTELKIPGSLAPELNQFRIP